MGSVKRRKRTTRGQRNIAWIERYCRVPEGKFVGRPVKLRPWQRAEILRIYDNPAGTRTAILSFGRKNGKTALSAFLLLLHLCGPEALPNSQLYSCAQSRDQAALLFSLAAKCVRLSSELADVVTIRDTAKELFVDALGTFYKALSADASTAYGKSPCFLVHDELGQVRGPRSELYEAMETATGAQESPLSIIISTQAPTDGDLLSMLIDDAIAGHDKRILASLYTADKDADPFAEETIRMANPAYGDFLNAAEVSDMAAKARRMPSLEASYRNLVLNQRVEAHSPYIAKSVWDENNGEPADDWSSLAVFGGLDLSSVNDLTALILIALKDNLWHIRPIFWLPEEGLAERSRNDRVPYDVWARQGYLRLTPGKTVEYSFIAYELRKLFDELSVSKIAFDRWNFAHLQRELVRVGFHEDKIEQQFVPFGQGYQSMSPALRILESDLLNGKVRHGGHPVLTMCAGNARVESDPAGNRKLAKHKSTGRIDGMVGLAMARSVAAISSETPKKRFQMMIVG